MGGWTRRTEYKSLETTALHRLNLSNETHWENKRPIGCFPCQTECVSAVAPKIRSCDGTTIYYYLLTLSLLYQAPSATPPGPSASFLLLLLLSSPLLSTRRRRPPPPPPLRPPDRQRTGSPVRRCVRCPRPVNGGGLRARDAPLP